MTGNSKRAAWNKAMGLPSSLNSNRTEVKKRLRRDPKATSSSSTVRRTKEGEHNDAEEYLNIIRLDRIERGGQVNFPTEDDDGDDIGFYASTTASAEVNNEEEYDELDELTSGKNKKHPNRKRKTTTVGQNKTTIPKWMRPRTLSSILIEESSRPAGILKQYLNAEAKPTESDLVYPSRSFCPVTGLLGMYTDPKTRIPYASLSALEQIRERSPPWMTISGGSALYHETVTSLRYSLNND